MFLTPSLMCPPTPRFAGLFGLLPRDMATSPLTSGPIPRGPDRAYVPAENAPSQGDRGRRATSSGGGGGGGVSVRLRSTLRTRPRRSAPVIPARRTQPRLEPAPDQAG